MASDEIKVHVVDYGEGRNLMMRYRCSETRKQVARSTGTTDHREALKIAAKWEAELHEGRYQKRSRMTWEAFRDYYSANALPGLAKRTGDTYESTLNVFEALCNPQRLADVTTARVTAFVTTLRVDLAAEATVAHHLRHLKAAMRWANKQGLLATVPQFTMPKRARGAKIMRGRPITTEEFERMLAAVPSVLKSRRNKRGIDTVTPWQFYLQGLWLSGLRLSESITLRWDDAPNAIVVDFTGRRPMFRIPAEAEKGNQDRLLPMAPEFAELLANVPESNRRGTVFKLPTVDGKAIKATPTEVSRVLVAIGKRAGVVVDERMKGSKLVRKFASAHDLRRAFGRRWAEKIKPTQLRELMRHASITTTLAYYVGEDAEATADALWAAVGNTLGNTRETGQQGEKSRRQETAIKPK